MKNLTGITLNGEWLGNNVLINGMFREICSISPVVMQEFIHIVNGIDELENAVSIQKFNCKDKNSIDIEFANRDLRGLASLYFSMDEGNSLELINSFLKLDRNEDDVYETNTNNAIEMLEDSVSNKSGKKSRKKSKRKSNRNPELMGEDSENSEYYSEENYDDEEYYDDDDNQYAEYDGEYQNDYDNAPNMNSEYQPGSYDGYACDDTESEYYARNEYDNSQEYLQNSDISQEEMYENGFRNPSAEGFDDNYEDNCDADRSFNEENAGTSRRSRDQRSQLDDSNNSSEYNEDEYDCEGNNETTGERRDSLSGARKSQTQNQRNLRGQNVNARRGGTPQGMPAAQGRGQGRVTASSDLQQIVITADSININPSDFEPGARRNRNVNDSDENRSKRGRGNSTDNVENGSIAEETSIDNTMAAIGSLAAEALPTGNIIIPEIINENYNPEDISEFLADFYTTDKIEAEITREQALLDEIASLKEEINSLHGQHRSPEEEEETPMTLEEFYARQLKKRESKANTYGYTFRIVGTNKRLRANVLDPELFIAGDKLYKWGERLYLEN